MLKLCKTIFFAWCFVYYIFRNCDGVQSYTPNACPKLVLERRTDGSYFKNTKFFCCADYMEVNDKCIACPNGTYGQNCGLKCPPSYYGLHCKDRCNCKPKQRCDSAVGCVCSSGKTGDDCSKECKTGYFGLGCHKKCLCSENARCNIVTGHCLCHPGYRGQTCHQNCPQGSYGLLCSKKCHCQADEHCDHVTGKCLCQPGFHGSTCNETCSSGYRGPGCKHTCDCSTSSVSCDIINGTCYCLPGWAGRFCEENFNVSDSKSSSYIAPIVILVILLISSILLYIKRDKLPMLKLFLRPETHDHDDDSVHYEDIDQYAEIPDDKVKGDYPYDYADGEAPPIKLRDASCKKTHSYLSVIGDRLTKSSKVVKSEDDGKRITEYQGLVRKDKCASYDQFKDIKNLKKDIEDSTLEESDLNKVTLSSGNQ